MDIVFMGTPVFATASLRRLAKSHHRVLAVVTGRDKPVGRGRKLRPTPVREMAESLSLPVLMPHSVKSTQFVEELKALKPDLLVICAFRVLPPKVLATAKEGAINIHTSLLPKYRGAAPIHWAIINGDRETGLTSFFLDETVDTGRIILQEKMAISDDDTFDTLSERMMAASEEFILETLRLVETESAPLLVQDESQATRAPKITPFDAMIDWGLPAEHVRNFVRGMATRPGAWTLFRGNKLKIHRCAVTPETVQQEIRPGTVVQADRQLVIQCGRLAIELQKLVPQGKREMDGRAFINGYHPESGEVLGAPRPRKVQ